MNAALAISNEFDALSAPSKSLLGHDRWVEATSRAAHAPQAAWREGLTWSVAIEEAGEYFSGYSKGGALEIARRFRREIGGLCEIRLVCEQTGREICL